MAMPDIEDEKVHEKVAATVIDGLKGTPFEPSSVQRLAGGLVNWGYRATLSAPLNDGTSEVFLKHGEMFLAKIPNYEVDILRCVRSGSCLVHSVEFKLKLNVYSASRLKLCDI